MRLNAGCKAKFLSRRLGDLATLGWATAVLSRW
jgi:hypothetical protein